jgi:single-strand DNA-binding protein
MYLNKVTLIGYLAGDAQSRVARDGPPYVTFEVATKESWKDASGAWQSHSELHRCIAWGTRLVPFTAALKKGTHVHVEGSLRSREYDKAGSRHRVWEVRLTSVLTISAACMGSDPNTAVATE